MIKLLINFAIVVVLGIMGTIIAVQAHASDRLIAYIAAYEAGTLYPDNAMYQDFFAANPSRKLTIEPGPATPTRDLGTYTLDLGSGQQQGIILIRYDETTQAPILTRVWPLKRHLIDHGYAGQTADLGSTAVGIALGATEMNPLFGPIINNNPVLGLVVLGGAKYALIKHAENQEYEVCVTSRAQAARLGYAFGANNVAGVTAGLLGAGSSAWAIGGVAGLIVYSLTRDVAAEDAAIRCFEAQED